MEGWMRPRVGTGEERGEKPKRSERESETKVQGLNGFRTALDQTSFIQRLSDDDILDGIEYDGNVLRVCGASEMRVDLLVGVAILGLELLLDEMSTSFVAVVAGVVREATERRREQHRERRERR